MNKIYSIKWLAQARNDLKWTTANIASKIYYGACFTAQQAAEKALKAYLHQKGKRVKIHDLGAILEECKKFDHSFEKFKKATAILTDYYMETRYPDIEEFMEYSQTQAREAQKLATKIVEFVEAKIK